MISKSVSVCPPVLILVKTSIAESISSGFTSGTTNLIVRDDDQNPEIRIKYGDGANNHWAVYVNQADQISKER
jgi:hypothetical protein